MRNLASLDNSNAELALTDELVIVTKLTPSSEYCQVPRPVRLVMAIPPSGAPGSASVMPVVPVPLLMSELTLMVFGETVAVIPIEGE